METDEDSEEEKRREISQRPVERVITKSRKPPMNQRKSKDPKNLMMRKPMVYVVHGWEAENIDSILRQVKKKCSDNGTQQNDFICIGSSCLRETNSASSLTAYLINIYRTHGVVKVDRTTILSADDAMLGLQLCLADINLQATGEFDALLSDVLTDQCSSLDEEVKCLNDKSFIIFDYPVNVVEKAMFSFLCSTRDITNIVVKESSLEDNDVNLKFQSLTYSTDLLESYSLQPSTLKNNRLKLSPTQTCWLIQAVQSALPELLIFLTEKLTIMHSQS
ncbi:unnamed protein product [Acanthosepion pharaonis]|uniref:PCNA-interacting partner n=1 Tax=Acanthosepion pharaonis TaxID=158019 RepID=A0A812D505_ACAPH|nr:unnamed protein product [Sepia pharaonis]